MNNLIKLIVLVLMASPFSLFAQGNCDGWGSGTDSLEAIKNHVLYRDYFKQKDYEEAFPFWEYVYQNAPSGSKKHFLDGEKMLKHFYKTEEDSVKKVQLGLDLLELYDRRIECFGEEGYVLGKKSFDLFYTVGAPYEQVYETGKKALEITGVKTKSFVIYPYAHVAVTLYRDSVISADEARSIYEQLDSIYKYGVSKAKTSKDSVNFVKAWQAVQGKYDQVAYWLFDCAYFVSKEEPNYKSTIYDREARMGMLQRLRNGRCDESDPLVIMLVNREKGYQDSLRKSRMDPSDYFYENWRKDSLVLAFEWYEKGMACDTVSVDDKFKMNMIMGKHHYRDLRNKPAARKYFKLAAKMQPNNAEPIYMIGELYASSGPDCGTGTGWNSQRVVWPALDKWQQAININPNSEFATKARKKITEYTKYMPTIEQIHQRNLKEGASYTVPCWIQERTTIRAYNPFK
ncbi:MAG: hypothetical protein AAF502_02730 [Bacteroidota bacterium]